MDQSLRVAVVTGAARGIGLAVTRQFASRGWAVAMLDNDVPTLESAAAALREHHTVLALATDVSQPEQVRRAVEAIDAAYGHIDALVNNAGIAIFKPLMQTSFEDWNAVMATNLSGPFLCTQQCAPVMLRRGRGSVVNIASISGLRASTLRVAYGTSKAALIHLTKQQAAELGVLGIRVNAIAPGPVDTAMAKQVHTPAIRADYHDVIPLNRYGTEDEIAEAVWFLCSDQSSYVNGQVLAVDGGFDASGIGLPTFRAELATRSDPATRPDPA